LPERFRAGLALGEQDVEELRVLLARRDQHNQRLYRDLQEMTRQLESANAALRIGVIGRLGYLLRRVAARLKR